MFRVTYTLRARAIHGSPPFLVFADCPHDAERIAESIRAIAAGDGDVSIHVERLRSPASMPQTTDPSPQLTDRDLMAVAVLESLNLLDYRGAEFKATRAYELADAMMKARAMERIEPEAKP